MDRVPASPPPPASAPSHTDPMGFVRFTRFTIPADRRSDMVGGTPSPALAELAEGTLLVALDDGDWLEIVISRQAGAASDAVYLGWAREIVGDEDGVIAAAW